MSVFKFLFIILLQILPPLAQAKRCSIFLADPENVLAQYKSRFALPHIPSLNQNRFPGLFPPQKTRNFQNLSPGIIDPILEEARNLAVFEDFKILSDLQPRKMTSAERQQTEALAAFIAIKSGADPIEQRRIWLREFITLAYRSPDLFPADPMLTKPKWKIESDIPGVMEAFAYIEETWGRLTKRTPTRPRNSLIALPYPMIVPSTNRFGELYYWDTYFGIRGLLATKRNQLAEMQIENLLELVRRYGHVPNGSRDYYLSRSQPPFLSSAVREVWEASSAPQSEKLEWLRLRALPLLKAEYAYWMNPKTRYDSKTGLNHHWDELNTHRPERHSVDVEEVLGKTPRDVRASAESGMDFTKTHAGETTKIAPVMLNAIMYKMESDLKHFCEILGDHSGATTFEKAMRTRKNAMEILWNEEEGRYENYHLERKSRLGYLMADNAAVLFAEMVSADRATNIRQNLRNLLDNGGLRSNDSIDSVFQWDGLNGWAVHQMLAMEGLRKYGFHQDAFIIGERNVRMIASIFLETGLVYERNNVATQAKPNLPLLNYPVQEGFLWTNSMFVWTLKEILGYRFIRI